MNSLDRLLETYRSASLSERDKGTALEKLIAAWLTADPVQSQRFKQAELWSEWVMERQCVKTDKASGIVSDANRYAVETVGDPRDPLDLFLRVITVSLETMKIVRSLPELTIE